MLLTAFVANLAAGPLRNIKFPSPLRRLRIFLLDSEEGTQKGGIHARLGLHDIPQCDYLVVHPNAYCLVEFSDIARQRDSLLGEGIMLKRRNRRKPDSVSVLRAIAAEMRGKAMGSLLALYSLHAKFKICVAKMAADSVKEFRRKKLIYIVVAENFEEKGSQDRLFMQSMKTRIEGGMGKLLDEIKVVSPNEFERWLH